MKLVEIYGNKRWSYIAQLINGRTGKQCRERWLNHLRPNIKKDEWTAEEERILAEGHSKLGTKWSSLAKLLPGRTENSIKNHWNATLRCKGRLKTTGPTSAQTRPRHIGGSRTSDALSLDARKTGGALGRSPSKTTRQADLLIRKLVSFSSLI